MTIYIALLRAVNVGGTGKLPMAELRTMCEDAGFRRVRTYIASGNVVFESDGTAASVKAELGKRLAKRAGKPVGVTVRTAPEMAAMLAGNPFPKAAPNHVMVIFLDRAPPADAADAARGADDEEIVLGERVIYVHYPRGMGRSKLKIPAAKNGTARNMNTVARLADMAAAD